VSANDHQTAHRLLVVDGDVWTHILVNHSFNEPLIAVMGLASLVLMRGCSKHDSRSNRM
jgi:hypothetical protein